MIKKVFIFVVTVLFLGAMNLPVFAQTPKPSSANPSVPASSAKSVKSQKPVTPNKKLVTPPAKIKKLTQPTKPVQKKPSGK